MPYLLRCPSSADSRLTIASAITAPTTAFKLELDFAYNSTAATATYLQSNTGSSFDAGTLRVEKSATNTLQVVVTLSGKSRVITNVTGAAVATRLTLTIEWDSSSQNIVIKRDTTTVATLTGYATFNIANILTILVSTNSAPCDIYGLRIYKDGSLVNNYDPSGTSSGNILYDVQSANNATQAGTWPTDNSEWVFYSSGASNSATISGNLPKLVGSITLNEINPINSASVDGQLPKLAGAVSLLQKQSVTVAGQMPKLTGSASLRLKQSAAVSGQLPRMTGSLSLVSTSNNKQITVTATMPKMTSSIQLSQELTAAVAGNMPRMTADIQLRLAGVYPQANANAFVVSYRIAGDTVLTASISESTRFSAIISQSTNIKYMVN